MQWNCNHSYICKFNELLQINDNYVANLSSPLKLSFVREYRTNIVQHFWRFENVCGISNCNSFGNSVRTLPRHLKSSRVITQIWIVRANSYIPLSNLQPWLIHNLNFGGRVRGDFGKEGSAARVYIYIYINSRKSTKSQKVHPPEPMAHGRHKKQKIRHGDGHTAEIAKLHQ